MRDARNASIILTGKQASPGSSCYQDSTRAELSGCYGTACFFHLLHALSPLSEKCATMSCDSTSAFDKLSSSPVKLKCPHCDIVAGFNAIVRNLPTRWKLHHVDGHQDKHAPFKKLDVWAQENSLCDKAAGRHLKQLSTSATPRNADRPLCGSIWKVCVNGQRISHDLEGEVDAHVRL